MSGISQFVLRYGGKTSCDRANALSAAIMNGTGLLSSLGNGLEPRIFKFLVRARRKEGSPKAAW